MFFSFMCLHNIMKLLLNKWQCLGCDACIVSSVLFLQSPDLAPILFLQSPNFLSAIDFDVIWNHQSLYRVKWIICIFPSRCFMHQVNLWNTMWAWWLYLPVEPDTPHVKSCIMFFSFKCLHNFMKLFLNKWQCLGCDACNFSPVLFLQSPDLAPILFLQSPNFLSAIDFDVIWNHQSLVLSQMNQLHISFKVFHAVSEFVKNHVSLMIVPSCWAGHSSCKKLHHVLLFQMSS